MRKYNPKSLAKRTEERKNYPDFYKYHIEKIKKENLYCDECGHKLIGDVSEVAHILNKSFFKSVACENENILYLCSWKSGNNCHSKFDNGSNEEIKEMKIFPKVKEIYTLLKREVTEKINYKIEDRYSPEN